MNEVREVSIVDVLSNPSKYAALYFSDSTPLEKIRRVYFLGGREALEFLHDMRSKKLRRSFKKITYKHRHHFMQTINKNVRKKCLDPLTFWSAIQFKTECSHDIISSETYECKCFQFLRNLISDVEVMTKTRRGNEYKVKV